MSKQFLHDFLDELRAGVGEVDDQSLIQKLHQKFGASTADIAAEAVRDLKQNPRFSVVDGAGTNDLGSGTVTLADLESALCDNEIAAGLWQVGADLFRGATCLERRSTAGILVRGRGVFTNQVLFVFIVRWALFQPDAHSDVTRTTYDLSESFFMTTECFLRDVDGCVACHVGCHPPPSSNSLHSSLISLAKTFKKNVVPLHNSLHFFCIEFRDILHKSLAMSCNKYKKRSHISALPTYCN